MLTAISRGLRSRQLQPANRGVAWIAMAGLLICATAHSAVANRPPVSVRDTLDFQEIKDVKMAPDGNSVAFVTRVARLDEKKNQDTLNVVAVRGRKSHALFQADELSQFGWSRDGRSLYGLAQEGKLYRVVRVDVEQGTADEIWETTDRVDALTVSSDGSACLVATAVLQELNRQEQVDHGVVYDYSRPVNLRNTASAQFTYEDFHLIDTRTAKARRVARRPYEGHQHLEFVNSLVLAPDLRHAAIEITRPGKPKEGGPSFNHDIGVLSLDAGDWIEPIPKSIQSDIGQVWLDERRIFFFNDGLGVVYDLSRASVSRLSWAKLPTSSLGTSTYNPKADEILFRHSTGLVKLSLADKKIVQLQAGFLGPSFADDLQSYALVTEGSEERPQVAVYSAKTKRTERLTNLNSYLEQRALGRVEKISLTNAYGTQSTAYLVYPVNYMADQRYPLLLGSYGFNGRFLLVAEWHATFPVQTLAGQGFATLLVNTPPVKSAQVLVGDPVLARQHEGWQVLSTFETAIQTMVQRGIADPKNIGLYGWSHGAFIVEFILAHSKLPFSAACIGEGGDYNPGGYWLFGGSAWPGIYLNTFGGPFTAKTASAYLEFSPVLNIDNVQTPLLMEFRRELGVAGLEMYVPLREEGKPAELVLYEQEQHNFVRPTVRFASMNRKIDWFNFWMFGKEDAGPGKAEQYARWRQMKADWQRVRTRETARVP